jgi:hypothetical protein
MLWRVVSSLRQDRGHAVKPAGAPRPRMGAASRRISPAIVGGLRVPLWIVHEDHSLCAGRMCRGAEAAQ